MATIGVNSNRFKKISIPKDLHRGLKSAAAQADMTLQEYVVALLRTDLLRIHGSEDCRRES